VNRIVSVVAALASCAAALAAHAGCFVDSGGLAFGAYDVGDGQPRDSMLVLKVSCQDVQPRDLSIAIGPSATSGQVSTRQMQGGSMGDRLSYNLFVDAARNQVWGDGTVADGVTVRGVARGTPRELTVFGRVPPRQNVSAGTYSDAITVTVNVIR
jgi:spore coat protein U-like protein